MPLRIIRMLSRVFGTTNRVGVSELELERSTRSNAEGLAAMSARDKFMERFERKRREGLLDVKFFIAHAETLSREDFFAAANMIDALIDAGECEHIAEFREEVPTREFAPLLA